jgi:hypothetical protein
MFLNKGRRPLSSGATSSSAVPFCVAQKFHYFDRSRSAISLHTGKPILSLPYNLLRSTPCIWRGPRCNATAHIDTPHKR